MPDSPVSLGPGGDGTSIPPYARRLIVDPRRAVYNFTGLLCTETARASIFRKCLSMGFVDSNTQRRRLIYLLIAGGLALLTVLLLALSLNTESASAQISPLSPLMVATPMPEEEPLSQDQPQIIQAETPSPLAPPQSDNIQSATSFQNPSADRSFTQSPLSPLNEPTQAQVSLILVGALLVGLGLLVIVVLLVRRRE